MARDFQRIAAWRRAHALTLQVYQATSHFPVDERYGLVSQLRRACSSIPANIAEGCGRDTNADLARFVDIAAGTSSEVEYQLLLSRDLGYLFNEEYVPLSGETVEIRRMLLAFRNKLRA